MKHGDQAKAKSAKAVQASGKKVTASVTSPRDVVQAAGKVKTSIKAGKASAESSEGQGSRKAGPAKSVAKASTRGSASEAADARRAAPSEPAGITNPVIAASFERAVKKYPNTFRRLTD